MLSCAPYGYRYVKKTEHSEGFWEIDEVEAQVVREVFARYINDSVSIGELARWLTGRGVPTRTGKTVWDRSSVWGCCATPPTAGRPRSGRPRPSSATASRRAPPAPAASATAAASPRGPVGGEVDADRGPGARQRGDLRARAGRLADNAHFAKRNTKQPTLLQGILVCRECGYACYRTSTRTTNKRIYYYRCIGSDNYRHIGGRVCHSRPIRADELDALVWDEVRRLLEDPALVRAEIDRRLQRCGPSTPPPGAAKRSSATSPAPPARSSG